MDADRPHRVLRSLAYVMAKAVKELRPDGNLAFGPAIDTGCYYDSDSGEKPLSDRDFPKIEKKMRRIIPRK